MATLARNLRHRLHVFSILTLKTLLAFVVLVLAGVAVVVAVALLTYENYASDLVSPEEMLVNRPSAGARILDRNGKLLYEYVDDEDGLRRPVRLDSISPAFLAATVATEDADFFKNPGVNPRGLLRAAWENFGPLIHGSGDEGVLQGSGGSSITQQLVKNVYIPREQRQERSIDRKLRELVYATELTKRYDKPQILEWYVNQISYGGIYTGIEAASRGYFGKPARDLTLGEAALLAGIPQSPARYDPLLNLEAAYARRSEVLDLMAKRGAIQIGADIFYTPDADDIEAARGQQVELRTEQFPIRAPHFVLSYVGPELDQVVGRDALLHDGLTVTTSIDIDLQDRAQEILNGVIGPYERQTNTHNGAVAIFEPSTGEILAMVGSRDYFSDAIEGRVNNLLGGRSPGSSFKPFVYLSAFMKLGWTPGTVIIDSPIAYQEIDGSVFQPQNPVKNSYRGPISVRNALGNSLNVPAFKTALQLGAPDIIATATSLGFTSFGEYYGPSIAIGGVDLRGLDLTYGYSVLANGGVITGQTSFAPERPSESQIQPVAILKVAGRDGKPIYDVNEHRSQRRVAPAEQAYMIYDILSDPAAACVTFGCGGLNVPGYRVAVKTGTSQPYDPSGPNRDKYGETWAFGYTPDFAVGVWAGNSNRDPVSNLFSTTIAFPVMRDIMLAAYGGRPQKPYARPPTVVVKSSCASVANLPGGVRAPGSGPQPVFPTSTSCTTDLGVGVPGTSLPPPPPAVEAPAPRQSSPPAFAVPPAQSLPAQPQAVPPAARPPSPPPSGQRQNPAPPPAVAPTPIGGIADSGFGNTNAR